MDQLSTWVATLASVGEQISSALRIDADLPTAATTGPITAEPTGIDTTIPRPSFGPPGPHAEAAALR